ncbi:MAG: phage baseplate protein, partial [Desulfobacterales bacterium]|nr:phage baseplate protein [Desulfobacterales bacterium]
MRSLSARDLLYVWEAGEDRRPLDRALMLLAALLPGRTREQLARLSIGRRDALLLNFRKATFGSRMDGVGRCPKCNGLLEFSVHVDDLLEKAPPGAEAPEPTLSMDGFHVRFRLPDSLDLAAVIHREDAAEAGDLLVRGCALEVRREGADASAETLPREVIEAMAARMAEQDPLAEIRLDLSCPDCGN